MRLGLLPLVAAAGLLSVPVPREAAAISLAGIAGSATGSASSSTTPEYYYRGVHYPYRYHGMYYRHRYWRYGRWHYH